MVIIQNLKVLLLKLILKHIFISIICLIGSRIYSQNVFVTYYPETNKIRESYEGIVNNGDTLKDGAYKIYHNNDSLWQIGCFRKDTLTGQWLDYFPSGQLKQKLYFKDGLLEDTSHSFYENGGIYQINVYKKDSLNGNCLTYFNNGLLKEENYYLKNLKNGEQKSYYQNGNIKDSYSMLNGKKFGEYIGYYKDINNQVQKVCFYNNIGLEGKLIGYYESGNKMNVSIFNNDTITGEYKEYFDTSILILSVFGHYKDGEKNGDWQWNYPNGETHVLGVYDNSLRTKEWKIYYPNKKLKQKGSFLLGKEDGEWMFYSEDGNLNLIGYYSSGTRVGQWTGYHSINKIKSISFYHKGKKNGMAYGYDLSGKLVETGFFVDGKVYYSN